ncbi:putative RNA-directed DNA polymerase from transposon X-element [Nephila pilipes]|uniref:Putative RNA-directed DNA polymerase from transposon X-element n=1 Tax=Nephila pilipes TaxID=299642 RepID=A0A8X6M590_NEPPI|nr:putative RNA-directed DNA polymerase from transposon X-element [Nephila pilipes]
MFDKKKLSNAPHNIVTWISNRILSNLPEFQLFIIDNSPDIIAIQETFLQPANFLNFANYTTYCTDRTSHRGGAYNHSPEENKFAHHLINIFRNRHNCFIIGDLNARHQSWKPTSRNNPAGNTLLSSSQNYGIDIIAPNKPTYHPNNQHNQSSAIDLGLAKGIQNISVSTSEDLSSDHNPVYFLVGLDSMILQPQNRILLTNTMCGNPPINDLKEIRLSSL